MFASAQNIVYFFNVWLTGTHWCIVNGHKNGKYFRQTLFAYLMFRTLRIQSDSLMCLLSLDIVCKTFISFNFW